MWRRPGYLKSITPERTRDTLYEVIALYCGSKAAQIWRYPEAGQFFEIFDPIAEAFEPVSIRADFSPGDQPTRGPRATWKRWNRANFDSIAIGSPATGEASSTWTFGELEIAAPPGPIRDVPPSLYMSIISLERSIKEECSSVLMIAWDTGLHYDRQRQLRRFVKSLWNLAKPEFAGRLIRGFGTHHHHLNDLYAVSALSVRRPFNFQALELGPFEIAEGQTPWEDVSAMLSEEKPFLARE